MTVKVRVDGEDGDSGDDSGDGDGKDESGNKDKREDGPGESQSTQQAAQTWTQQ